MVSFGWLKRGVLISGVGSTCALAACDREELPQSSASVGSIATPVVVNAAAAAPEPERAERPAAANPVKEADPKACLALCKIGDELECGTPFPLCVQQCQEMIDVPKCSREMQRAIGCFAGQPARAWECDPATKMPSLKEGPCGEEQRLVAECMQV